MTATTAEKTTTVLSREDTKVASNLLGALATARDTEAAAKSQAGRIRDGLIDLADGATAVVDADGVLLYTADERERRSVKVEDFVRFVLAAHPEYAHLVNTTTYTAVSRAK